MRTKGKNPMSFFTIAIVGLFLAGFFLLVVFGARSYGQTAGMQSDHMEMRALTAYIATSVAESDEADSVRITDGPEGPVLVIADGNTGYGKRIWQREGHLVEDYAEISEGLSGDQANVIAETSVFEVERPAADRLSGTTDEGRTLITLRSEGGDGGE